MRRDRVCPYSCRFRDVHRFGQAHAARGSHHSRSGTGSRTWRDLHHHDEQQKKIFIIVGAVAGFLVLFGIVYGVLSSAVFSAKSVANSYVAAISSGNYDKANTIADPHVNTNQRALLTSKASSGENTRITNARISQTSNNADGTVSAQLTYTLEGKEVNGNFTIKDNKVSVEFSE